MNKTTSIDEKIKGCRLLANLKVKKISLKEIRDIADFTGMKETTLAKAWINFVETGGKTVDKRHTTGYGTIVIQPKKVALYTKYNKKVTAQDAGDAIFYYMTTDASSREIANKYKMSVKQFYGLIDELNVKGSLLGKKVLNPKKYAKVNVLDVIWLYKHPDTNRKSIVALTELEKIAYRHVADVLLNYLPRTNK